MGALTIHQTSQMEKVLECPVVTTESDKLASTATDVRPKEEIQEDFERL